MQHICELKDDIVS